MPVIKIPLFLRYVDAMTDTQKKTHTPVNRVISRAELRQEIEAQLKTVPSIDFGATPVQLKNRINAIADMACDYMITDESQKISFGQLKQNLRSTNYAQQLGDKVRDTLSHLDGMGRTILMSNHSIVEALITRLKTWQPAPKSEVAPPVDEPGPIIKLTRPELKKRITDLLRYHPDIRAGSSPNFPALTPTIDQRAELLTEAALPLLMPTAGMTPQDWKQELDAQRLPGSTLAQALKTVMEKAQAGELDTKTNRTRFSHYNYAHSQESRQDITKAPSATHTADKLAKDICGSLSQWMEVEHISIAAVKGPKVAALKAQLEGKANSKEGRAA